MASRFPHLYRAHRAHHFISLLAGAALAACGGGQGGSSADPAAPVSTQSVTLQLTGDTAPATPLPALPASAAQQAATPTFHAAPVLLEPPSAVDAMDPSASAHLAAHVQAVTPALAGLNTRGLTLQLLESARRSAALAAPNPADGTSAAPMAASMSATTYTPAQIRAAYGLPALPASGSSLTATQAAQLGAGQTVYIVDANGDPNVAAELAAFNQTFGLPGCSSQVASAATALPLPAPSTTAGCALTVAYSTANATLTNTAPAYDSGWATEIALDVQWAHATAPLARIVLIEAPDASLGSLLGAVQLANAMGPGVVSMSFGGGEGSWTASVDAAFAHAGMTYLAATGDAGAQVCWPAVSTNVVAVGGTSLTYTGTAPRSEVAWSGTGGGISQYVSTPSYQTNAVPGIGALAHRAVPDVAFNADPGTGQYVAVSAPGSTSVGWLSVGGTSLATPQWAGLVAVANALRATSAKVALGAPQAALYGQIAAVPGSYASAFLDVTAGSDGSCATCRAQVGFDAVTGLGTPNAAGLLAALTGSAVSAPVVTAVSASGKVGTALGFTVPVSSPDPVTWTLGNAPAGMTIASSGAVSWPAPVAGTYAVTVVAKDTKTGLSGQAVATVTIAAAVSAPVVTAVSASGKVGTALGFTVPVSSPDPVTLTLGNAPAGMSIASSGAVSWPAPVAGTYAVTVVARDTKTGLSGQAVATVTIAAAVSAPVVTAVSASGKVGTALGFTVPVSSADPVAWTLGNAPAGMTIASSGAVSWPAPVAGTYAVTVVAKDTKTGLSGQAVATVTIAAAAPTTGPVITASTLTGPASKALSGTITLSDAGASALSVSIAGVPSGMSFAVSGSSLLVSWLHPVQGSYVLVVVARDNLGRSSQANVPVTITAP